VQKRIFSWLGREFIDLSGAARPAASVEQEISSLFRSFEQELKTHGLSWRTLSGLVCGEGIGKQETSAPLRGPRF